MARDTESTLRITALTLAVIALAVWIFGAVEQLFERIADVALVFVFAWALAYLLAPVVTWLERRARLGRLSAVLVVYAALVIALAAALALVVPVIFTQLSGLVASAPQYGERLTDRVLELQRDLVSRGINVDLATIYAAIPERLAAMATAIASQSVALVGATLTLLLDVTLVAIVSFFMLVDGDRLWRSFLAVLPADLRSEAELLRYSADRSFGGFMRGQLILGFAYGIVVLIAFLILKLPFAALLALASGLLMIIPFFGAVIATFPPVLVALTQGLELAVFTFVAVAVIQNVMTNVVGPRLMAQTVGIHPLLVFAALLIGARVAGLWGVFLALPIAGMLNVFARYALEVAQGRRARTEASRMLSEREQRRARR
jgi:predicted PurR-regulated permease PerM